MLSLSALISLFIMAGSSSTQFKAIFFVLPDVMSPEAVLLSCQAGSIPSPPPFQGCTSEASQIKELSFGPGGGARTWDPEFSPVVVTEMYSTILSGWCKSMDVRRHWPSRLHPVPDS